MRERPILFSGPMVRALLDGSKTQTRRAMKPQPNDHHWQGLDGYRHVVSLLNAGDGVWLQSAHFIGPRSDGQQNIRCPYGAPGDVLWVKESVRRIDDPVGEERWCDSEYIADGAPTPSDCWPWKNKALPSMYMPRGMSRISLAVESVRVERVQDISEADARAEGMNGYPFRPDDGWPICTGYTHLPDDGACTLHPTAVKAFEVLWSVINGPESWAANPWVWVVSFRRVK